MLEKDHFMKFIKTFFDALNQIILGIDRDDFENVKIQISDAYQLLGNSPTFFLNNDLNDILLFFKKKDDDYLKRFHMLAELMYYDALIHKKNETKISFLEKSILLLEYYFNNTKEYSLEINNKLTSMKHELATIEK